MTLLGSSWFLSISGSSDGKTQEQKWIQPTDDRVQGFTTDTFGLLLVIDNDADIKSIE